ncbi:MAG: winged helix-turn-helix domain-containing protein [Gordonia polyisoprenivorans]|nr:winged helix-turn-helix domain-containing protein [Gordonia polyisoprenivorans]
MSHTHAHTSPAVHPTHRPGNLPLLDTWRRWSPRDTVRLDHARDHRYRSGSWPTTFSDTPVATYLADTRRRFRLIALDLDAARLGPAAVRADADTIAAILTDLDVPHLITQSGPTGGQHIWIRVSEPGITADEMGRVARQMRQHLPTLDISPLTNAATGAVRIPGSPHRHTGESTPVGTATEIVERITAMDTRPAPPNLADWLIARFPATTHQIAEPASVDVQPMSLTGHGPTRRLARPKAPLSDETTTLLDGPLPPHVDRSARAWTILLSMAASGWTWNDVQAHIDAPGLTRLREDHRRRPTHTSAQWTKALTIAATTAWPRATPQPTEPNDPVHATIASIHAAAHHASHSWGRKGWASAERVLYALTDLAGHARALTIDIDVRRLAESANVHYSTASRALHRLASEGWVVRTAEASGTHAATWQLLDQSAQQRSSATQVETRPPSPTHRLQHCRHDVWVWRTGLGGAAERIHYFLSTGLSDPDDLAAVTGYTRHLTAFWLKRFQVLGMTVQDGPVWDTVARQIGSDGTMHERAQAHVVDRLLHEWWSDELAWRRRRGKKRHRARKGHVTDPNFASLPIAAPARTRYGRFPTLEGRADYRRARSDMQARTDARTVA